MSRPRQQKKTYPRAVRQRLSQYPHNVIQPDLKVKVCVHVLNESKERSKYQRLCNLFPKAVFLDSSKSRRGELYKGG